MGSSTGHVGISERFDLKFGSALGEINFHGIVYCSEPVKQLCHRCKSEKSPLSPLFQRGELRAEETNPPLTKGDYRGI
jgi:hypothetical protein